MIHFTYFFCFYKIFKKYKKKLFEYDSVYQIEILLLVLQAISILIFCYEKYSEMQVVTVPHTPLIDFKKI